MVDQLISRFVDLYISDYIDNDYEMILEDDPILGDVKFYFSNQLEFDHNGHVKNESFHKWCVYHVDNSEDYLQEVMWYLKEHFSEREMELLEDHDDDLKEAMKKRLKEVLVDLSNKS